MLVPILPRKFLLLVATTTSPSVRIPPVRPQHNPQPGCVTIAPASTSVSSVPSARASLYILRLAGVTINLTNGATFLPLRIAAAH